MWDIQKHLLDKDLLIESVMIVDVANDAKKLKLLSIVQQGEYFALFLHCFVSNSQVDLEKVLQVSHDMKVAVYAINSRHFKVTFASVDQELQIVLSVSEKTKRFMKKMTELAENGKEGFVTDKYHISSKKLLIATNRATVGRGLILL